MWDILPEHLKEYVREHIRNAEKHYRMPIELLEKLFIDENLTVLNFDNFESITNAFLASICNRISREKLTSLSFVNNTHVKGKIVTSILRGCVNVERLNFKGCIDLSDDAFPEKVVEQLTQLSYVNVSYTQVTGKAIALIYSGCPKLATLKLAGCRLFKGTNLNEVFRDRSDVLISLKLRHCGLTQTHIHYILQNFPNLQTLDCSSSPLLSFRTIRPFLNISHASQLRKLNLSNCPHLDLSKSAELNKLFILHPKLEQIYLTGVRIDPTTVIPKVSLANFKTLFMPGTFYSVPFLSSVLQHGQNLTYLDLSRTNLTFQREDYPNGLEFDVPHLRTLSLDQTLVDDESAELISQIHTLRSLFLRNTAISTIGVRVIVFACPWLGEVDVASCRGVERANRRTLIQILRKEFWDCLPEAKAKGKVLSPVSLEWYNIGYFRSEDEERAGLVRETFSDEHI